VTNPWSFTGAGQRFALNARIGVQRTDVSMSLTEPWFMGQQLALTGELFYRDSQFFSDSFTQTNMGAALTLRKPLTENTYVVGEYRIEQVDVQLEPQAAAPSLFAPEAGDYLRSGINGSWVYDTRDALIVTRDGWKVELGANLAGTFLGGDVETYGVSVRAQRFWNFRWDTILSVQGEMAFVDAISGNVPVFDRLFLGGARTLRGFDFRDVGPRDPVTQDVLGGQSLGFLSAEFTAPVITNVRAAVFYDLGFVNAAAWDPSPEDLYHDVGFGVRLQLPISPVPIALDYAIPVESPDPVADQGGRFQFSLQYEY
jgi:outer membrane protein insertion porin family